MMRRIFLVIVAAVVVAVLAGCNDPIGGVQPAAGVSLPQAATALDDWADITAVTDDELSQEALKERFLNGFVDKEGNIVDEAKLDDAIKWLNVEVPDNADKLGSLKEFILGAVIGIEYVPEQQLADEIGHAGLVEIRKANETSTTVICWHAVQVGSWSVIYDDRDADAAVRYNVLLYGLDRSLSDNEVTQLVLDFAKHRPAVLAAYYYAAFDVVLDINALVVDSETFAHKQPTFMSEVAEAKWLEFKVALETATAKRRNLTAEESRNLFNTGSDGSTFHKSYSQGVGGEDVLVIIWHLKSGRDVYALFRCGNVVIPNDEKIPSGGTDDCPDPPEPDPVTPTAPDAHKNVYQDAAYQSPAAAEERGSNDNQGPGEVESTPKTAKSECVDHDWGPYIVETPAKVGIAGWEVRTCKKCGRTDGRAIAALPTPAPTHQHNWVEKVDIPAKPGVAGSGHWECSADGTRGDDFVIPALPVPPPNTG
ncbi:MAG: hypothetical protein LBU20_00085, partial [Candidatus Nomurabacteria bacterium]|nr:hypothetical protein [Candidatus Nomurabacteria bacterium]